MSDVYENCPAFENDKFLLRFSQLDDAGDLVSVYSDKNALPFFNSDNCHGDNFYYPNEDRMRQAIKFWLSSYSSKWFVRWTIIDKEKHEAIGTIEVFHRSANDDFNHVGVLRLDLKSEYETSEEIFTIMNLIVPPTFDLFECEEIITKVPVCITKISTFLILCDLAVCLATLYVSFSLVFALMRYLQGKVFLIRFYSPTTLSSSRAEFRLPSRLACA